MRFTRIAIATSDGVHIAEHLARSTGWIVLDMEGGGVLSRTLRSRESDTCGNHATFVDMLTGCDAVICGGIGASAASDLAAAGIKALVVTQPLTIEQALKAWQAGTLATTEERVCLCSH